MINIKQTITLYGVLLCAFLFAPALHAQESLNLLWGDGSSFADVTALPTPYQATMDVTSGNVQIKIQATFSGQGAAKTRQITVNIPRGYMIKEYTAKSGTTAISGVTQLALSPSDDGMLTSSVLTAADGTPFTNQLITDYTGMNGSPGVNVNYRPYDGKVVYTFNSTCNIITLILTLAVDIQLIPHTDPANVTGTGGSTITKYTLPDITVVMTSGAATLSSRVGVLMNMLAVPSIATASSSTTGNGHSAVAEGVVNTLDSNKGTCDFNTGWGFNSYINSGGQGQYIDTAVISIPYPPGVTYKGFLTEASWNTNQSSNPANGSYLNGHLTVNNDPVTRVITFTFNNLLWGHTGTQTGLQVFWSAVVDNGNIKWNQRLDFNAQATFTSGSLITGGPVYTYAPAAVTTWRTPVPPSVNLTLSPTNRVRRDLNAPTDDFPYGWAIGQFNIANKGPSVADSVKYEFTFLSSPQVTGVRIPCVAGTTDVNVVVTGTTSKGRYLNYTFDLGSIRYNNTQSLLSGSSAGITAQMLEEDTTAGEYLLNLTIVQQTLHVNSFTTGYVSSQTTYYGKFANGQEGDVKLTLSANGFAPITATDHTTIGWQRSGAGVMYTRASHMGYAAMSNQTLQPGDSYGGTFYPGDPVYFETNIFTGSSMSNIHANEIIDPVMYINLPAGFTLDASTIQVLSAAGKHGPVFVPASVNATQTKTINGVVWNSYRVQVNNKYDIIARGLNNMNMNTAAVTGSGLAATYTRATCFTLRFKANIDLDASAYPAISMDDLVNIDLGKMAFDATDWLDCTIPDAKNWTGKGTSYKVMASTTINDSPNLSVVQKPGLNVYLGIRSYGSPQNFYYYNGSPGSIARLSPGNKAELRLQYQNTSSDVFHTGSEIYLPIPTKNLMYDHYFNNTERNDPASVEDAGTANMAPLWTARLASQAILPGFKTEYGVSLSPATNYLIPVTNSWEPVTMQWYNYADLLNAGYTLADVTCIEFEATQDIAPVGQAGSAGEDTLLLDMAPGAVIGDINFWRSYEKGWRTADGAGNWMYGSVVAAMPAVMGVIGKFFFDANLNGAMDTGEAYTAAMPMPAGFTAALSGAGITDSLLMTIDAEGNFRSLNSDSSIVTLMPGNYTVKFTNASPTIHHFSNVTPATRSYLDSLLNIYVWYHDIQQGSILRDNTKATFNFQVKSTDLNTQLIGVALKNAPRFIPVNPQVRGWVR